jgi:hypothetical protein
MLSKTKSISILLLLSFALFCSCRSKTPWNPYLSAREKPSDKQRKEDQKQIESGTKAYKEQMKKNKKEIQGNINKATSMKPKHRKITKNKRRGKKKKYEYQL